MWRQTNAPIFCGIKRDSLIRPNGSACLTDSHRAAVSALPAAAHSREMGFRATLMARACPVPHYSFISARRNLLRLNAAAGALFTVFDRGDSARPDLTVRARRHFARRGRSRHYRVPSDSDTGRSTLSSVLLCPSDSCREWRKLIQSWWRLCHSKIVRNAALRGIKLACICIINHHHRHHHHQYVCSVSYPWTQMHYIWWNRPAKQLTNCQHSIK